MALYQTGPFPKAVTRFLSPAFCCELFSVAANGSTRAVKGLHRRISALPTAGRLQRLRQEGRKTCAKSIEDALFLGVTAQESSCVISDTPHTALPKPKNVIQRQEFNATPFTEKPPENPRRSGDEHLTSVDWKKLDALLNGSSWLTIYSLAREIGKPLDQVQEIAEILISDIPEIGEHTRLTYEEAHLIAEELNAEALFLGVYGKEIKKAQNGVANTPPRQATVAVVGHVNHGKTSLLNRLHQGPIAQEVGGITQAVAVCEAVMVVHGQSYVYTLIDTPGHQAFYAMKKRGTHVADAALLIVAADDGPQRETFTVLELLRFSRTPFAVVLNKIDRLPFGGLDDVILSTREDLQLEKHVAIIPVSARTGANWGELQKTIVDLTSATQDQLVRAHVPWPYASILEAHKTQNKVIDYTCILQHGVLKLGSLVLAGHQICARLKEVQKITGEPLNVKNLFPGKPFIARLSYDFKSTMGYDTTGGAAAEHFVQLESHLKISQLLGKLCSRQDSPGYDDRSSAAHDVVVPVSASRELWLQRLPRLSVHIAASDEGSLRAVLNWISEFNKECEKKWWEEGYPQYATNEGIQKNPANKKTNITERSENNGVTVPLTSECLYDPLWSVAPFYVSGVSIGMISGKVCDYLSQTSQPLLCFYPNGLHNMPTTQNSLLFQHYTTIYQLLEDLERLYNCYFGPKRVRYETAEATEVHTTCTIHTTGKLKRVVGEVALRNGYISPQDVVIDIWRHQESIRQDVETNDELECSTTDTTHVVENSFPEKHTDATDTQDLFRLPPHFLKNMKRVHICVRIASFRVNGAPCKNSVRRIAAPEVVQFALVPEESNPEALDLLLQPGDYVRWYEDKKIAQETTPFPDQPCFQKLKLQTGISNDTEWMKHIAH